MGGIKTISIIVAANIKGLEQGLGKANKSLTKFASGAARMGSMLSFGITAPLVAMGKQAFDTFSKFENAMMKVNTVTGASVEEFKMLTSEAKRLGATTQFTASQVADLQLVLGRKGFDPTAIKNMEESILDLALATGEDLSLAAETVSASINAFGLDSKDASSVANTLASAAANSSIQLSTFSTAFGHAGASAKAVGVDIEELSAMMGVLMDNGIKASKAGTGLRKAFMELNEQGRPFGETLKQLSNGTMTLNQAQRMVGKTGANQLLILAENKDKLAELTDEYKSNTGRLKEMADAMGSTTFARIKKMQSAIEAMKLEMGGLLADVLTPVINKVTSLANSFTNLDDRTKKIILVITGIAAAIGPMLLVVASATAAYSGLGIAIGALTSPIGLAVAALVAIPIAIKYVLDNWEALIERFEDIQWWKNALIDMIIFFVKINPFNQIIKGFNIVLRYLKKTEIPNPFDNLEEQLKGIKKPTKQYKHEFGSLVDSIKDGMKNLGIELPNIFSSGGGTKEIVEDFEEINETIQRGFGTDLGFDGAFTLPEEDIASFGQKLEAGCNSWGNKINAFFDKWGDGINIVGDIFGQMMENQSIQLENRHKEQMEAIMIPYEQELANIENSMMSEEQKAEAKKALDEKNAADVKALEEKTNKERAKIQRKQAIADKVAAIIAATINGAQAITKVAGQTGIGAIAAAPMIAGLVAAQIGTIAAQPIPKFAEGGIVSGPTMGMMGEYAGARSNPEVIAPLDKLQSIIGNQNVNVTVSGVLSSEGIQLAAIRGQEAASQKGASLIGGNFVTTPF